MRINCDCKSTNSKTKLLVWCTDEGQNKEKKLKKEEREIGIELKQGGSAAVNIMK